VCFVYIKFNYPIFLRKKQGNDYAEIGPYTIWFCNAPTIIPYYGIFFGDF